MADSRRSTHTVAAAVAIALKGTIGVKNCKLMKVSLAAVAILIAASHGVFGQTNPRQSLDNARAVEELKQADRAWMVAPRNQANLPARERVLADEFYARFQRRQGL